MTDLITAEEAEKLLDDVEAMRRAVSGEYTDGTFHAANWSDKPHRALYDCIKHVHHLARTVIAIHAQLADAERDTLAARLAASEGQVKDLRDFIDDFAKAKIDALRYSPPYGSSPDDEPDPVVDAETVWAWQADARAALATQEAGNG